MVDVTMYDDPFTPITFVEETLQTEFRYSADDARAKANEVAALGSAHVATMDTRSATFALARLQQRTEEGAFPLRLVFAATQSP